MAHLKRLAAVFVVAFLGIVITAVPAQAHDYVSWTGSGCLLNLHRNVVGGLDSIAGTCNAPGDNYWRGTVKDNHAPSDGHCVFAELDGIVMASSCSSGGTTFTFLDPQRNQSAPTWICRSDEAYCRGASNVAF
ncbi:hypothetical protein [Actinoplanes sp. ATCC 53533]|uniref:hypothetical protein n=1 Tax=Actinoplanes sp. ATCC 53533 TaxID=1288362 RepID=UPI000F76C3EC|nr:hypothetical protein [Actinoplanes sp. ATCC 53533]